MRWFSHCFATIDNFCLVFLQWLNKTNPKTKKPKNQNQKNKKQKPKKNTKWQVPTLCHYSPPWGVQYIFFLVSFFSFFCFLFSGSLLVFLQWLNATRIQKTKKTRNQKNKTQLSTTTPPLGVCNLFFLVSVFFKFSFLVSCFLVRCWFFEGLAKQHKSEGPRPSSLPVLPL